LILGSSGDPPNVGFDSKAKVIKLKFNKIKKEEDVCFFTSPAGIVFFAGKSITDVHIFCELIRLMPSKTDLANPI
jgi:hypothetical protein